MDGWQERGIRTKNERAQSTVGCAPCRHIQPNNDFGSILGIHQEYEKSEFNITDIATSTTRIEQFGRYLTAKYKPNTVVNKLNHLKQLMDWLIERKRFSTIHAQLYACTRHVSKLKKKRKKIIKTNRPAEVENLHKEGRMLDIEEIRRLHAHCVSTLNEATRIFNCRKLLDENKQSRADGRASLRGYAYDYQTSLQILILLRIGAQQRQVVSGISSKEIEVSEEGAESDCFAKLFLAREKPFHKSGIPLPKELYDMIDFFRSHVRPHLRPNLEVETLWIAKKKGGVQEGRQMTEAIKNFVAQILPDKQITPISLRRSIPTILTQMELTGNYATVEDLLKGYAALTNTSLSVVKGHYALIEKPHDQAQLVSELGEVVGSQQTNTLYEDNNQLLFPNQPTNASESHGGSSHSDQI